MYEVPSLNFYSFCFCTFPQIINLKIILYFTEKIIHVVFLFSILISNIKCVFVVFSTFFLDWNACQTLENYYFKIVFPLMFSFLVIFSLFENLKIWIRNNVTGNVYKIMIFVCLIKLCWNNGVEVVLWIVIIVIMSRYLWYGEHAQTIK